MLCAISDFNSLFGRNLTSVIGCLGAAHIILRDVVVVWYLVEKTSCPIDESGMIGEACAT